MQDGAGLARRARRRATWPSRARSARQRERTWKAIRALLGRARLSKGVRERSLEVFERIARAEARIHGIPIDRIHFHEVGAVDALGDVVGVCAAVEALGVARDQLLAAAARSRAG